MAAIGRVPAVIALLKRTKRPMSSHEIAALFRDQGDEHCSHKTIGETLRNIVKTKPDVGICRAARRGYYVYVKELDVPVSATRSRSDELTESPRVAEIRAARRARPEQTGISRRGIQWPTNDAITSGDPALKDAQVVLPSGAGPNEPIDYAAQARHPGSRLSDHTADCAIVKDGYPTCTCGAYTRATTEGVNPLQPTVTMDASWASARPFPFTHIRIVRTLADGRVLFTDDPTGKAWVAKEV